MVRITFINQSSVRSGQERAVIFSTFVQVSCIGDDLLLAPVTASHSLPSPFACLAAGSLLLPLCGLVTVVTVVTAFLMICVTCAHRCMCTCTYVCVTRNSEKTRHTRHSRHL